MADKLAKVVGVFFGVSAESVTDASSPEDIAKWDSLEHLLLLAHVENEYKVKFRMEDALSVRSVGDIRKFLKDYGAAL